MPSTWPALHQVVASSPAMPHCLHLSSSWRAYEAIDSPPACSLARETRSTLRYRLSTWRCKERRRVMERWASLLEAARRRRRSGGSDGGPFSFAKQYQPPHSTPECQPAVLRAWVLCERPCCPMTGAGIPGKLMLLKHDETLRSKGNALSRKLWALAHNLVGAAWRQQTPHAPQQAAIAAHFQN